MRHTAETRAALSERHRGEGNPMFGRKHTPETRAKLANHLRECNARRVYVPSPLSVTIPAGVSLGYFAGLVDGEGSIRFSRGRPFVAVYNTELPILEWIVREVGGTIGGHDDRGRKTCYSWRIGAARDVYAVCRALLPCLIAKRADALAALAHLDAKYGEVVGGG